MATTSASTAIDPTSAAKAWTDKYTADQQTRLTAQANQAKATANGLSTLKTAISAYQSSLTTLSAKSSLLAQGATFSDSTVGSATASASAVAGSYSFFVEQLASANQISISGLGGASTPLGGTLNIDLQNGSAFTVDLHAADKDGSGGLTAKEIAAAINAEPHNSSMVTASIITIAGEERLVLSSGSSGEGGKISVSSSGLDPVADATLVAAFSAAPAQLVAAQDAVVWLGAKPADPLDISNRIKQGSNTFTGVAGVSVNFTKAQASGAAPVTLTVALDNAATTANAQSFVDAYNKLKAVLDDLGDPGDPQKGVAASVFAQDSGLRALRDQMVRTLRDSGAGSLAVYGIKATRAGLLELDSARLGKALAANPTGLDTLLGSTKAGAASGIAATLDKYLSVWSNGATGQLVQRQASVTKLQSSLETRQAKFETDYVTMYNRYKAQFTQLQQLQTQMAQNTDMFDALFGSSKN